MGPPNNQISYNDPDGQIITVSTGEILNDMKTIRL
jgi:hypothetical protein